MKEKLYDEAFIRFVQIVRSDDEFRGRLKKLLKASDDSRSKLLTLLAMQMRQNGVPEEFAHLMERLRDKKLLKKIVEAAERDGA